MRGRRTVVSAVRFALGAVAERLHVLGPGEGLLEMIALVLKTMTGHRARLFRYQLVVQPVTPRSEVAPRTTGSVERILPGHPFVAAFPRPPEVIARRFEDNCVCLAASVKDGFAGFLWLRFDRYHEDEVRCLFVLGDPARSAWDFDVYVEPEFRLGRTFRRLWNAADRLLGNRGIRWTFSRISSFNVASLAAHRRLGARRVASATFLCLGTVQLSVFSLRPYVHLSLSRNTAPMIVLTPPDDHTA